MATDEEVAAQRKAVNELREKLMAAQSGSAEKQREVENDITMTQLVEEEARLQAQLAEANHANKVTVVRQGATPLATAEDAMKAAIAHQKAVEKELAPATRKKAASSEATSDADTATNTDAEEK